MSIDWTAVCHEFVSDGVLCSRCCANRTRAIHSLGFALQNGYTFIDAAFQEVTSVDSVGQPLRVGDRVMTKGFGSPAWWNRGVVKAIVDDKAWCKWDGHDTETIWELAHLTREEPMSLTLCPEDGCDKQQGHVGKHEASV